MDALERKIIARDYRIGQGLASDYFEADTTEQIRIFKAVANESDNVIHGFMDGVLD